MENNNFEEEIGSTNFARGEEKADNEVKKHKKKISRGARIFGYIVAILVNVAILYVVNNLLSWNLSFVTERLNDSLFYINLSIYITIAANIAFIIYDNKRFKNGAELITNIFALIATYYIFANYPFDFTQVFSTFNLELLVKIGLVCSMIGIGVAMIVNFVKLFKPKD